MLRRLIGLPRTPAPATGPAPAPASRAGSSAGETATVRAIVEELDQMPTEQAKFLAGFAYILSRTANADLHVSDDETRQMERIVVEYGHIPEAQAVIVVQIAKTRAELFGPTEDYLVTREFRRVATDDQCLDVLRCCFLIGAADGTITAEESGTLSSIADELGVEDGALRRLRSEFAEQSAALQELRRRRQQV